MKIFTHSIVAFAMILLTAETLYAETRTFTSTTGTTLQGELVSVNGDVVTIKKADGQPLSLKMSVFSPTDQAWLQAQAKPLPVPQTTNLTKEKLEKIIFPTIQIQGCTLEETLEYLRVKSRDLDTFTDAGAFKGVDIVLSTKDGPSNASLTLDLKNIPMWEALRYVTELAQMKFLVDEKGVVVVGLSSTADAPTVRFNEALTQAERGEMRAQYRLAGMYIKGVGTMKNAIDATKWFRKAAEQGLAEAQDMMGVCYQFGLGVSKDEVEAVRWYRKAAEQGYADAEFCLGDCYFYGKGVLQDDVEAVKWFRKAAEQGNDEAQEHLGICYELGVGVPKDITEAVKLYRLSAIQGNSSAQSNLAGKYVKGEGVPRDDVEACAWYVLAEQSGHAKASEKLKTFPPEIYQKGLQRANELGKLIRPPAK